MPIFGSPSASLRRGTLCLISALVTSLSAGSALASDPETPTTDIAHGKRAGECALPPVVKLKMGNECTGTLVHPQVIVYAAHCRKLRRVILGENIRGGKVIADIKKSITHPDFSQSKSRGPRGSAIDWAVGVLAEPVKGLPIIPLAYGAELDQLQKKGKTAVMAGFGKTEQGMNSPNLMWTNATINEFGKGFMVSAKSKSMGCPGDSGGPLIGRLEDGSWRLIGITTNMGPGLDSCGKPDAYNLFSQVRPEMVKWLEKESGFDLTPCYDENGKVDKTAECTNFFAGDLESPTGSWSNNCADAKVVKDPKLSPKGGAGEEDNKDKDKDKDKNKDPKVSISGLDEGDVPTVGDTVKLEVKVGDSEFDKVTLSIDDKEVKSWKKPPYTYKWKVKKAGERTLIAKATDADGKETESEELEVTVDKAKKDPDAGKDDKKDENNDEDPDNGNNDDGKNDDENNGENNGEDDEGNKDDEKKGTKQKDNKNAKPQEPAKGGGCSLTQSAPAGSSLALLGLLGLLRRRRT